MVIRRAALLVLACVVLGGCAIRFRFPVVFGPPGAAAPGNFAGAQTSSRSIRLAWTLGGKVTGFQLERLIDGQNSFTRLASLDAGTRAYDDLMLTPNTGYMYRLRGIKGNQVSAWVLNAGGGFIYTPPDAPPPPDFTISISPGTATAAAGFNAVYSVAIAGVNGFSSAVSLNVSALPGGAVGSFNPSSLPGTGISSFVIQTLSSTIPGSYTFTITATSGTLVHSIQAALVVNPITPPGDFSLSVNPGTALTTAGQSATYSVTVNPINGFAAAVNFTVAGLPVNAGYTFNPASVGGGNSGPLLSTLAITTATFTPPGTYALTITGVSGTLTRAVSALLTINPAVACGPTVSGMQTLVAAATDNVGVVAVHFVIDGGEFTVVSATPPYVPAPPPFVTIWNTGSVPNGCHTVSAYALDQASNRGSSPDSKVEVQN